MLARDTVMPEGRWSFDGDVTEAFDDMLRRSIPQYDWLRAASFRLGSRYVKPGTSIIDLGCSRGEALQPFVDKFGAHNRFVGIDVSEPMLAVARERFAGYLGSGVVDIRNLDLRTDYPPERASLVLSVLTLQFIPIEFRQQLVRWIRSSLISGGALILVEKVLGETAHLDEVLVAEYLDMKRRNGYTEEQIERKRLSLQGVLVPVTARWNEDMLRAAGFAEIDCFWRQMNFAGWLAIARGAA